MESLIQSGIIVTCENNLRHTVSFLLNVCNGHLEDTGGKGSGAR